MSLIHPKLEPSMLVQMRFRTRKLLHLPVLLLLLLLLQTRLMPARSWCVPGWACA